MDPTIKDFEASIAELAFYRSRLLKNPDAP